MNEIVRTLPRPRPLARPAVELVAFKDACGDAWDELAARAADPNPFATRHVVGAHVRAGLAPPDLPLLVARRGRDWLAALPLSPRPTVIGFGSRARSSWSSPFNTLGTPLLAGDETEAAAEAFLDGLAASRPELVLLRNLRLDGGAVRTLEAALHRRRWPHASVGAFQRAVLDRENVAAADPGAWLAAGRRKDLRRRRTRLAIFGALEHRTEVEGPALAEAVEQFLYLEASGWKGARGTALASRPPTLAFARLLFAAGGGPVAPRADLLTLDGRPVAASLSLVCAGTAFLLKTAYDENHRRHAPGLLLEEEIVRACLRTGFADRLDSAADEGHVIGEFLPGRERVGDLLFAPSDRLAPAALARLAGREEWRRRWLGAVKAAVNGWRKAALARSRPGPG